MPNRPLCGAGIAGAPGGVYRGGALDRQRPRRLCEYARIPGKSSDGRCNAPAVVTIGPKDFCAQHALEVLRALRGGR